MQVGQRGHRRRVHRAALAVASAQELEELVTRVEHCRLETHPHFFDFFVEGCQFKPRGIGEPGGGMIELARHPSPSGRAGGRVSAAARLSARARAGAAARASWPIGRASGTREHGRPWIYAREAGSVGTRRRVGRRSTERDFTAACCAGRCSSRQRRDRRDPGRRQRGPGDSSRKRRGSGTRRSPTNTSSWKCSAPRWSSI